MLHYTQRALEKPIRFHAVKHPLAVRAVFAARSPRGEGSTPLRALWDMERVLGGFPSDGADASQSHLGLLLRGYPGELCRTERETQWRFLRGKHPAVIYHAPTLTEVVTYMQIQPVHTAWLLAALEQFTEASLRVDVRTGAWRIQVPYN